MPLACLCNLFEDAVRQDPPLSASITKWQVPAGGNPEMSELAACMQAICDRAQIIPVMTVEDADRSVPLAQALLRGGIRVLEVTLRTPAAIEAIRQMAQLPACVVGAGTLLTAEDVQRAKDAGAAFGVSPGSSESVMTACHQVKLPLMPGAASATEVMHLLDRGYTAIKFFPAEAAGGVDFLKAIGGPLPAARFCATGGIGPRNLADYLLLRNVCSVGGGWMTSRQVIEERRWNEIEKNARAACAAVPSCPIEALQS